MQSSLAAPLFLKEKEAVQEAYADFLGAALTQDVNPGYLQVVLGPFADIKARLKNRGQKFSMSLTEYPEIAIAAGGKKGQPSMADGQPRSLYLLALDVPEISLIRAPSDEIEKIDYGVPRQLKVGSRVFDPRSDSKVEVFSFDALLPNQIASVKKVTKIPALTVEN